MIAGGPGAGKTTLLDALAARGYLVMPDTARAIIRARKLRGWSPRPPPAEFAEEILRIDSEKYLAAPINDGPVFFERGVLDALAMLHALGHRADDDVAREVSRFPYLKRVFVLPPWQQIYCTDSERDQTFAESVTVHAACCEWYRRWGYQIVEVPHDTVEHRCDFVVRELERDQADLRIRNP